MPLSPVLWLTALIFLLGVMPAGLTPAAGPAQASSGSLGEQQVKAFTWFGTLGFPDVKGRTLVRVATGRWYRSGDDPARNTYVHGFLLKENGDAFSVLTLELVEETFQKTPAGTPAHEQVGYEVLKLARDAIAYAEAQRAPERAGRPFPGRLWGSRVHPATELFVLAWACWRNGSEKAAAELYAAAARLSKGSGENSDKPFDKPLQQVIADKLAHAEMWRAVEAFGNPRVSRAQLLERFERLLKNYPNSEHAKQARETTTLLRKMVQEDGEYAARRKAGKSFDHLTRKEQIADLIFRLRDQNGYQYSQPGSCDIFNPLGGQKDTPAHRLVKMGYDAVPQLIEALRDTRFTRSVGFHRDFYFSHHVLRVGDCAEAILSRIAGRPFFRGRTTNSAMLKDSEAVATNVEIAAWWAELQKKGEKQMLLDAVARGDRNSDAQADLLLEKYPDVALPAILAGVKASQDSWTRAMLVAAAGRVKGDGSVPFLLAELKDGPTAYGRLVAARCLHERSRPEGVAAMIAEWNGQRPTPRPPAGWEAGAEGPWDGLPAVIGFLASCGKAEAIAALAKDLHKRPVSLRLTVVSAFGEGGEMSVISSGAGGRLEPGAAVRDQPAAVRAAIERLLISSLDDTEERTGMSGIWNGKSFSDPRICDIAGHVLNQLAPDRYPFDLAASLGRRNRSRVELTNVWRKTQSLPPLPQPAPRKIDAVPDKVLEPFLAALLRGTDAERQQSEQQIEKLGVGALPGIRKHLEKLGPDAPHRSVLERMSRRLACTVVEVVISDLSLKPDADLARQLKAMSGKPFDPTALTGLVRTLVSRLPKGATGFRFAVDRDGDGTGMTVLVDLLDQARAADAGRFSWIAPGEGVAKDVPYAWHFHESVRVGSKSLHSGNGTGRTSNWTEKEPTKLLEALTKASAAPVGEPIAIRIRMTGEWAK